MGIKKWDYLQGESKAAVTWRQRARAWVVDKFGSGVFTFDDDDKHKWHQVYIQADAVRQEKIDKKMRRVLKNSHLYQQFKDKINKPGIYNGSTYDISTQSKKYGLDEVVTSLLVFFNPVKETHPDFPRIQLWARYLKEVELAKQKELERDKEYQKEVARLKELKLHPSRADDLKALEQKRKADDSKEQKPSVSDGTESEKLDIHLKIKTGKDVDNASSLKNRSSLTPDEMSRVECLKYAHIYNRTDRAPDELMKQFIISFARAELTNQPRPSYPEFDSVYAEYVRSINIKNLMLEEQQRKLERTYEFSKKPKDADYINKIEALEKEKKPLKAPPTFWDVTFYGSRLIHPGYLLNAIVGGLFEGVSRLICAGIDKCFSSNSARRWVKGGVTTLLGLTIAEGALHFMSRLFSVNGWRAGFKATWNGMKAIGRCCVRLGAASPSHRKASVRVAPLRGQRSPVSPVSPVRRATTGLNRGFVGEVKPQRLAVQRPMIAPAVHNTAVNDASAAPISQPRHRPTHSQSYPNLREGTSSVHSKVGPIGSPLVLHRGHAMEMEAEMMPLSLTSPAPVSSLSSAAELQPRNKSDSPPKAESLFTSHRRVLDLIGEGSGNDEDAKALNDGEGASRKGSQFSSPSPSAGSSPASTPRARGRNKSFPVPSSSVFTTTYAPVATGVSTITTFAKEGDSVSPVRLPRLRSLKYEASPSRGGSFGASGSPHGQFATGRNRLAVSRPSDAADLSSSRRAPATPGSAEEAEMRSFAATPVVGFVQA